MRVTIGKVHSAVLKLHVEEGRLCFFRWIVVFVSSVACDLKWTKRGSNSVRHLELLLADTLLGEMRLNAVLR